MSVAGDTGRTAVLREWDQRHDRSPTVCVKSGERTESAVRVRAVGMRHTWGLTRIAGTTLTELAARLLRRPTTPVVLAVSAGAWRRWRRRLGRAVVVVGCGCGFVLAGVLRGELGLVVFGGVVAVLGAWMRSRSWRACWVGLTYRAGRGEVVVTGVHPAFADEARRLYVESVRRHPSPR